MYSLLTGVNIYLVFCPTSQPCLENDDEDRQTMSVTHQGEECSEMQDEWLTSVREAGEVELRTKLLSPNTAGWAKWL
jgi:hypothetical protein